MIPWDNDADIYILSKDEWIIRSHEGQRKQDQLHLVTRPGNFCPKSRLRQDCDGKIVRRKTDVCSFCYPLARIVNGSSSFTVEIYNIHLHKVRSNTWYLRDDKDEYPLVPHNVIFPLRPCKFMDFTLFCPNNSREYLIKYKRFGSLQSIKECVNGKWLQVKST